MRVLIRLVTLSVLKKVSAGLKSRKLNLLQILNQILGRISGKRSGKPKCDPQKRKSPLWSRMKRFTKLVCLKAKGTFHRGEQIT